MQSTFAMTSGSYNSYHNFLKYLLGHKDAAKLIGELEASCDPKKLAEAKTSFTNSEEVNCENDLRKNRLGRDKWPNERIRKVFVAAQKDLPAFYDRQAVVAAELSPEVEPETPPPQA